MDINELRQNLEAKTKEVRELNNAGKIEEAEKGLEEVRSLKKQIKICEELEAEEKRKLEQKRDEEKRGNKKMEKVNEMRALTKRVLGKELTEEERAVVKTSDVGSVIPAEYLRGIETYREGFAPLKGDCDVIPVHSLTGSKPTHTVSKEKFKTIAEGDVISEGSLTTSKIDYAVKKVGVKVPFSAESIDDAQEDIEKICRDDFNEEAVQTENASILDVLYKNATAYAGTKTDYEAIEETLKAMKPALKMGAIVYLNEALYTEIATMKDKQGRPLNIIAKGQNGQETFMGIAPVREFDSSMIDLSRESNKKLAIVANTKEAVKFFDRKQVTVSKWHDYDTDVDKLSVLERIDVKLGNARSITKILLA